MLSHLVGEEMLSRLDLMIIQPKTILDVGCGTAETSLLLKNRYPNAFFLAVDQAWNMVEFGKKNHPSLSYLCSDGAHLSFHDQTFDLITANFLLPWHEDYKLLLTEWKRLLRPGGLLLFTALGKDTLKELHGHVAKENLPHLHDMHDLGDDLVQLGLSDPVLDVDYYTMTYRQQETLYSELRATGMLIDLPSSQFNDAVTHQNEEWSLTYEIIHAHVFAPEEAGQCGSQEFHVPLSRLREQLQLKNK